LDEPTSALDLQTEEQILQTLRVLVRGRTTILVSHRPSLLDLADRVLSIEEGRVQEFRGGDLPLQPGTDRSYPAPDPSAAP
ncbi:MAG: ABC transporter ATP-binding protein, partial [Candidatus Methanoculleus thermohydrogenotrophicum]